jgi:hypothetical protein
MALIAFGMCPVFSYLPYQGKYLRGGSAFTGGLQQLVWPEHESSGVLWGLTAAEQPASDHREGAPGIRAQSAAQ